MSIKNININITIDENTKDVLLGITTIIGLVVIGVVIPIGLVVIGVVVLILYG